MKNLLFYFGLSISLNFPFLFWDLKPSQAQASRLLTGVQISIIPQGIPKVKSTEIDSAISTLRRLLADDPKIPLYGNIENKAEILATDNPVKPKFISLLSEDPKPGEITNPETQRAIHKSLVNAGASQDLVDSLLTKISELLIIRNPPKALTPNQVNDATAAFNNIVDQSSPEALIRLAELSEFTQIRDILLSLRQATSQ